MTKAAVLGMLTLVCSGSDGLLATGRGMNPYFH